MSIIEANSPMSPTQSPSLGPSRRLAVRRGSVSASDPWGTHASVNMNPSRSSSSRLTIVRVPQTDPNDPSNRHRRHGSNASLSSTSSKSGEAASGRLSFAFTTFSSGGGSTLGGRPSSPTSPRIRPASPSSPHRHSTSLPQHTKLTPEQLVELARSSCHPRPTALSSGPQTVPAPVSFTPLPDSIYLPFIERPPEVTSLISQQPSAKLFALLSQTFPAHARATASASSSSTPSVESDPKAWTYAELENWFKKVDRDEADDIVWVRKARECVLSHSELIWERIKGALGVPPELNVDDGELPPHMQRAIAVAGARAAARAARSGKGSSEGGDELDAPVFEPDSPVTQTFDIPNQPSTPGENEQLLISDPQDIISVEAVIAEPAPPPSTSAEQGMSSLQEVAEEEEEDENADIASGDAKATLAVGEEPEIHGLRFSTSPSAPSLSVSIGSVLGSTGTSPNGSVRSFSFVGGAGSGGASPSTRGRNQDGDEGIYDPLKERGPGRPLFPTSFAQLALGPSLGSSA